MASSTGRRRRGQARRRIASTFAAAGLPVGFHRAAGDVYERLDTFKDSSSVTVEAVLEALLR